MSYNYLLKDYSQRKIDEGNDLYEKYIKNNQTPIPDEERIPKDNKKNNQNQNSNKKGNNLLKESQNQRNNSSTPRNELNEKKESNGSQKNKENNENQKNDDVNIIINDYYYNEILKTKEKKIFTNSQYVSLENRLGENACYINVIIHFLYLFPCVNDYLIRKYHEKKEKNEENDKKRKEKEKNQKDLNNENQDDDNINKVNDNKGQNDKNTNDKNVKTKEEKKIEEENKDDQFLFDLGKILNDYQNSISSTTDGKNQNKITQLKTDQLRKSLSISSNNLFKLNNISDPVEFLIYILDLINKENVDELHDYFHLKLIEERRCSSFCPYKNKKKYDKDNFIYQIYVEEIFNYIKNSKLNFDEFKENLFMLSYYSLQNEVMHCEKCKNSIINKTLICNNGKKKPKCLLINCIWKNVKPEIQDVIKFLFLIALVDELDNLFLCPNKEEKENYYLMGIIFYSFSLCHYINMSYNVSSNVFTLHNDEGIIEFKNLNDLYRYLTIEQIKSNNKSYFYPVLLIYVKDEIYDEPIIPNINKINKNNYEILLQECEEEIKKTNKEDIPLTKEQKEKNYRELILAQIKYDREQREQNLNNLLKNKNRDRNLELNDYKINDNGTKIININDQNKYKNNNFLKANKKPCSVDTKNNNFKLHKPNSNNNNLYNNDRRFNNNYYDYSKEQKYRIGNNNNLYQSGRYKQYNYNNYYLNE